jgi:hypothetical protein
MKIEGKIAGSAVPVLLQCWQELAPTLGDGKLLVDLRGVTYVDEAGRNLLADIHAKQGAAFLGDTPLTKYFAEVAEQDMRTGSDLEN